MSARVSQVGAIVDDSEANPSPRHLRRASGEAYNPPAGMDAGDISATVLPHGTTRPASAADLGGDSLEDRSRPRSSALHKMASVARHDNDALGFHTVPEALQRHKADHIAKFAGVAYEPPSLVLEHNARMSVVPGHGSTMPVDRHGRMNSVMSRSHGFGSRTGSMLSRTGSITPQGSMTPGGGFGTSTSGFDSTQGNMVVRSRSRHQTAQSRIGNSRSGSNGSGRVKSSSVVSITDGKQHDETDRAPAVARGLAGDDDTGVDVAGYPRAQTPVEIHAAPSGNGADGQLFVETNTVGVTRPTVTHGPHTSPARAGTDGSANGSAGGGCCAVM
jgi:hypothetical protein